MMFSGQNINILSEPLLFNSDVASRPKLPTIDVENGAYEHYVPLSTLPNGDGSSHTRTDVSESLEDASSFSDASKPRGLISRLWKWLKAAEHEIFNVSKLAVPRSTIETICFGASLVSFAQVGKLGYQELSALTLGTTLFNITGLSYTMGLAGGVETFCGQVFGAGQPHLLGVILQRAILVCLTMSLPCYLLWWKMEPLLLLIGQPPEISHAATRFLHVISPALMLSTFKSCCRSYLGAQGQVLAVASLTATATIIGPILNYYFINIAGLGLVGAAMSYVCEEAFAVAWCILLVARHSWRLPLGERPFTGFSRDALTGWWAYLKVALPSTGMILLDWCVLEVMVLLAGMGPNADVQVGAMGLLYNAFTFVYYIVEGFGYAASTRVSNLLGAGHAKTAKLATTCCLAMGMTGCCLCCAALYVTQDRWARVFTDSSEMISIVHSTMPYVCGAIVGYSSNTVLSGVLMGTGRQELGFAVNLVTLWFVGLPLAATLSLGLHWGSVGLWVGIAVMNLLQGGVLAYRVLSFNWGVEVKRSRSIVSMCTPMIRSEWSEVQATEELEQIEETEYKDEQYEGQYNGRYDGVQQQEEGEEGVEGAAAGAAGLGERAMGRVDEVGDKVGGWLGRLTAGVRRRSRRSMRPALELDEAGDESSTSSTPTFAPVRTASEAADWWRRPAPAGTAAGSGGGRGPAGPAGLAAVHRLGSGPMPRTGSGGSGSIGSLQAAAAAAMLPRAQRQQRKAQGQGQGLLHALLQHAEQDESCCTGAPHKPHLGVGGSSRPPAAAAAGAAPSDRPRSPVGSPRQKLASRIAAAAAAAAAPQAVVVGSAPPALEAWLAAAASPGRWVDAAGPAAVLPPLAPAAPQAGAAGARAGGAPELAWQQLPHSFQGDQPRGPPVAVATAVDAAAAGSSSPIAPPGAVVIPVAVTEEAAAAAADREMLVPALKKSPSYLASPAAAASGPSPGLGMAFTEAAGSPAAGVARLEGQRSITRVRSNVRFADDVA